MKTPKVEIESHMSRPKFNVSLPLEYRGCKVYESTSKKTIRVVPRPEESPCDRGFPYKTCSKQQAWKDAMAYCEKPFIPKGSANYVKIVAHK